MLDMAKRMAKDAVIKAAGTEIEKKIAGATSNKPWGASSTMLAEIAQSTYDYQEYTEVMACVWKRVGEKGVNWRICYKALNLLDYLIRNGSERSIEDSKDHMYQLRALQEFQYKSPEGKDEGINVREKSKQICELLNDAPRLKEERDKARQNRGKFSGTSSEQMQGFGSSSGGGGGAKKFGGMSSGDARSGGDGGGGYASGGIGSKGTEKPWEPPSRAREAPSAPAPAASFAASADKISVNIPGRSSAPKPTPPKPVVAADPFAMGGTDAFSAGFDSGFSASFGAPAPAPAAPNFSATFDAFGSAPAPAPAPAPAFAASFGGGFDGAFGAAPTPPPAMPAAPPPGFGGVAPPGAFGGGVFGGPDPFADSSGFQAAEPAKPVKEKTAAELMMEKAMGGITLGPNAHAPAPAAPKAVGMAQLKGSAPAGAPAPMGGMGGGMGGMGGGMPGGMGGMGGGMPGGGMPGGMGGMGGGMMGGGMMGGGMMGGGMGGGTMGGGVGGGMPGRMGGMPPRPGMPGQI